MAPAPYSASDLPDPRNADIVVHVNGKLVPRDEAVVSVFDSAVQGGDAVWEGLRVYDGRVYALERHLDRLFASAHALRFQGVPTRDEVRNAVIETFTANEMYDEAHARLTLTRGLKVTSGMSPANNRVGCSLIVLAEWKPPVFGDQGIRLITASTRRNSPATLDSKIHHANLLNNILAKIEADVAGADDALMLDLQGFVAETNATNVFLVRGGILITPSPDACLPGITRGIVLELAAADGLEVIERNVSLSELYTADEVFTTGTMGELAPVVEIDGRTIGTGGPGPTTKRLRDLHRSHTRHEGVALTK
ncbi:MAG TPA: aminotransferase class IV [Actinomycetota bacterium]|nr:aminotransferase class IV [Actinomycetota bacterium]